MRSVAEPLAGVNEVGVDKVVQLSDALPSIGPEDAAERFSPLDDIHAATCGRGSAGGGCRASVGDDVAWMDQVDVAGRHPPCGHGPQAGSLGDAGHGVAGAHPHGNRGSNRSRCRCSGCRSAESPVDDLLHLGVLVAQCGLAGVSVAVVAAYGLVCQRVPVGRISLRLRHGLAGFGITVGVGVLVPLPGFATEHVQVQRPVISG